MDNLSGTTAALGELADRVEAGPDVPAALTALGKELHRLRGTAGTFGFAAAAAQAEALEAEVEGWLSDDPHPDPGARAARVRRFIQDFTRACGAR